MLALRFTPGARPALTAARLGSLRPRTLHTTSRPRTDAETQPAPPAAGPTPSEASPAGSKTSVNPLRPIIDVKGIRNAPDVYAANCMARNYHKCGGYPARIASLHHKRLAMRPKLSLLRTRAHSLQAELRSLPAAERPAAAERARDAKKLLVAHLRDERALDDEIERMALALPNLTSRETPRDTPRELAVLNPAPPAASADGPAPDPLAAQSRSHVDIGAALGILDFAASALTSGWGFYYLVGAGAQLEHALVQYALAEAARGGWTQVAVPSMVYAHIGSACGFQPRDAHDEQQVYAIEQHVTAKQRAAAAAAGVGAAPPARPQLVLAGTAEIPLAGMRANATLSAAQLPLRHVSVSRSFRAEAGARGQDTKGLYRVHEFTKVELFAWTRPDGGAATRVFDDMVALQQRVLGGLGLRCRVLEMPASDLGASAARKIDIEAMFPSRRDLPKTDGGWGELSSASICTDYQTRRLRTRVKLENGAVGFPHTVNGTALAVPRVIAAILETHWDEATQSVAIPDVLRPYMGGKTHITAEKTA
ncbi:hypothetical protein BROUX41_006743 [Berkeleyomyces rouxiae]|uniref:uncharacterized protein n=1 Tax=Berkeleyomyces rouxiae TaxID=2035830 RepID=UPI003B77D296